MRALRRRRVILRLKNLAVHGGMRENSVFLLHFVELPLNLKEQGAASNHGQCARRLRICEAEKGTGIDADEFHQETRAPRENQITAKYFPRGLRSADRFRSHSPEKPGNQQRNEEFVEGRRVDPLGCGYETVGKTHSPGKRCGNSIIAVARNQAADSSDAIPERGGRRGHIKHLQQRHPVMPRQKNQRNESAKESAEPCEAHSAEKQRQRIGKKFRGTLQYVIEPRARQPHETG